MLSFAKLNAVILLIATYCMCLYVETLPNAERSWNASNTDSSIIMNHEFFIDIFCISHLKFRQLLIANYKLCTWDGSM